jgi:hypothetical protein
MTLLRLAVLAALTIMLAMSPASAGIGLDLILDPIRPFLFELIAILATAAAGWLIKRIRDWTGIEIEARHREALQSALENAARLALHRATERAGGMSIPIGNAVVESGVEYVLKSVPDAVRHFGLTPERVGELIRPKLFPPAG